MDDLTLLRVGWVGEVGIESVRNGIRGGEELLVDGDFEVVIGELFVVVFLHGWAII